MAPLREMDRSLVMNALRLDWRGVRVVAAAAAAAVARAAMVVIAENIVVDVMDVVVSIYKATICVCCVKY